MVTDAALGKRIFDGFLTLEGGVDSGRSPVLLQPNQISWAINVSLRGGQPTTRPTFQRHAFNLDYLTAEQSVLFLSGRFQGSHPYISDLDISYLVASISGRIFAINLNDHYIVSELTPYLGTVQTSLPWVAPALAATVGITLNSTTGLSVGTVYAIDAASYQLVSLSGNVATFQNINDPPGTANPAQANVLLSGQPIPALDPNSSTRPHAWFVQAENWLIIQDGISPAFLWNGLTMTRSDPQLDQVPIGSCMAYGRGRLWVARDSLYFGGDLVWSDPAKGRDSVIYFTENTFLAEGGAFAVPTGPITGMSFAAGLDTATNDGDLLVTTHNQVYAFSAPIDRTVWQQLQYPIQRYAMLDAGSLNHESIVRVNGDLMFRSAVGVSSFMYARRNFGTWANTPISSEVRRILEQDSPELLYAASSDYFDNRMLMTCSPRNDQDRGVWHGGLVVIDFTLISNLGINTAPVWEGLWTGPRIFQLARPQVSGVNKCMALCLGNEGDMQLWELTAGGRFDDGDSLIKSSIETRGMSAQLPGSLKRYISTDLWLSKLAGTLAITGYYRNERTERWTAIGTQDICTKYRDCTTGGCTTPVTLREQGRSRIALIEAPMVVDGANGGYATDGYVFQVRLDFLGYWRLERFRSGFLPLTEEQFGSMQGAGCLNPEDDVCQNEECTGSEFCDPDMFSYLI